MGLVRRIVEMLLQAGISPCVGRNDGRAGTRPNFIPMGLVHRFTERSRKRAFLLALGWNDG